jgi:hypothetical protein
MAICRVSSSRLLLAPSISLSSAFCGWQGAGWFVACAPAEGLTAATALEAQGWPGKCWRRQLSDGLLSSDPARTIQQS